MALSPRGKLAAAIVRVVGVDPYSTEPAKRGLAPYFGSILRGLIRREMTEADEAVFVARGMKPTMGVSRDGILSWSRTYVDGFADDKLHELAYSLYHEVMHVALKHHERAEALGIVPEMTDDYFAKSTIANLAMDACDNEEIEKVARAVGDFKIPKWWVLPETLNQPRGLVFEERYRRLLKDVQEEQKKGGGGPGGQSGKKVQPGAGKGYCGGCAGHPQPGEPEGGKSEEGRSEAEMERFRKESAAMVKEMASKDRGLVPDSLQRWAEELLKPATIPWREKLARIVRGAVAYKSGASDLTFTRMSRRQAGVGYGVGRPVIPALHAPVPNVAVCVDTSGSMSSDDLAAALSEVQGVLAATGSNVTFLACDAAVHGIKVVKDVHEAAAMLKGGGGTAMAPAMTAIEKLRPIPSIAIFLTDGYIDQPPEPSFSVIWAIIGDCKDFKMPYGDVVFVRDEP